MAASGPDWYSPAQTWPHHRHPWFRDAFVKARSAGWWYRKAGGSGHLHGTAYCQPPEKRKDACKFIVFSTGEAGETAATGFVRSIQRCAHNQTGSVGTLAEASVRLDKVEMLCLGAEALLDQYQYDQRALELLDRAQELLEEAGEDTAAVDELLDCALELEEEARAAAGEAERTLGLAASGLRDAAGVLDLAEEAAMQVKAALKAEEPSAEVRGLKERVRQVRIKITSLRSRLTEK